MEKFWSVFIAGIIKNILAIKGNLFHPHRYPGLNIWNNKLESLNETICFLECGRDDWVWSVNQWNERSYWTVTNHRLRNIHLDQHIYEQLITENVKILFFRLVFRNTVVSSWRGLDPNHVTSSSQVFFYFFFKNKIFSHFPDD